MSLGEWQQFFFFFFFCFVLFFCFLSVPVLVGAHFGACWARIKTPKEAEGGSKGKENPNKMTTVHHA